MHPLDHTIHHFTADHAPARNVVVCILFLWLNSLFHRANLFYTIASTKRPDCVCQTYHIQPQLVPFNWVNDVVQPNKDTLYITLQLVMNIVFFVPLGIFMKAYFHKHWKFALLSGFLLSMLI